MRFSLSRWRPRHLLLSWIGYWAALFVVALGRPTLAAWRLSRAPEARGSVSASVDDLVVTLTVITDGVTTWSGSAHLLTASLLVAGPPLLLWVAWMIRRPKRGEGVGRVESRFAAPPAAEGPAALREPDFPFAGSNARTTRPIPSTVKKDPGSRDS